MNSRSSWPPPPGSRPPSPPRCGAPVSAASAPSPGCHLPRGLAGRLAGESRDPRRQPRARPLRRIPGHAPGTARQAGPAGGLAGGAAKDVPFRVEATCVESRIYHSGAAAERVARRPGSGRRGPRGPRPYRRRPVHPRGRHVGRSRRTSAASRRPSTRHRCARPSRRCSSRSAGTWRRAGARSHVRLRHLRPAGGGNRGRPEAWAAADFRVRAPRQLRPGRLAAGAARCR